MAPDMLAENRQKNRTSFTMLIFIGIAVCNSTTNAYKHKAIMQFFIRFPLLEFKIQSLLLYVNL